MRSGLTRGTKGVSGEELRQRLEAILAADAAGYSRLMAADEHATVAALDAARATFRSHIEAHHGRVIDMAGDSVLAVFETAAGAASAALAVQRALDTASSDTTEDRQLRFRIGVHLGDVIEKADGTVYGDGVNIAARLQGLAEPGGIMVSESIRSAVKGKVTASFEDRGEQTIKNIAEPVRAYRLKPGGGEGPAPKRSVADIDLSLPDKPSIAVLPFNNMSGDPEQEYFTDGVTEDIITELSRFKSLFVIARNSSFTYRGKSVDVRVVAKELGVRYVLEGSIRKASNRIRVTAQLIDSLSGAHIWAERYDRMLEDVFEVQEELTRAIVTAIAPQIYAAEREKVRRRRPESLSAYEATVRAWSTAFEAMEKSDRSLRERAAKEARDALALDPRSSGALTVLGWALWQSIVFDPDVDRKTAFAEAKAALSKAVEINPSDDQPHALLAWLLLMTPEGGDRDKALNAARLAHQLNPNSINALNAVGHLEGYQGNWVRGIEHLQSALRLSPRDPAICYTYQGLAAASCCVGEYANGVAYAQEGISRAAEYGINYALLAMNYVGLGELDAAKAAFETARRLSPGWVQARLQGWNVALKKPEDVKRTNVFMRVAAGLEDPSAADAVR
jgi:adenylate cyclase